MNNKWKFVPAVLGLVLAIGTATLFRACAMKEDGTWMHCHTAQTAVVIMGCVMCALGLAAALSKTKSLRVAMYGLLIAGACVSFLIPGVIVSMCMMTTMRCYSVMRPFVRIMAALIAVSSAVLCYGAAKGRG